MYADDLVLISRSEVGLQGLIDILDDYCKRWRMEVNTDESKIIKFSGNDHYCKTTFFYGEKLIENVINYKYLGLVFNTSGYLVKRYGLVIYQRFKSAFLFRKIYLYRKY